MSYIFDDFESIKRDLGKVSVLEIMVKQFIRKVHLADFGKGIVCNIPEMDLLIKMHNITKPNSGISIGFMVLDRGLMINFHLGATVCYLGIKNIDFIGWKLIKLGGDWRLWLFTSLNNGVDTLPIQFYVKNQNFSKVEGYFLKYGFKRFV